jgi:hypothetical protein
MVLDLRSPDVQFAAQLLKLRVVELAGSIASQDLGCKRLGLFEETGSKVRDGILLTTDAEQFVCLQSCFVACLTKRIKGAGHRETSRTGDLAA